MAGQRPVRPVALIDELDSRQRARFEGRVWRVVRDGYDPLRSSRAGGRWDDGTFDALYTSMVEDGAIAEKHYHLTRGQPVIPSRVHYRVHELNVSLHAVLELPTLESLETLGLDTARFGQLSYIERELEYPSSQQIAEVAHFLEFDGLIVPNARWSCTNLIIFTERTSLESYSITHTSGALDWTQWKRTNP